VSDYPSWSPDGREIVYHREAEIGRRDIWITPSDDGGEPRQITRGDRQYSHPQWSPVDLDQVLVVVDHLNLGVVAVSTGDVELLTDFNESTVILDYPSWSADGKKIYFSLARKVGDLYVLEDY
jgi:Tol biopolymer transport system component